MTHMTSMIWVEHKTWRRGAGACECLNISF